MKLADVVAGRESAQSIDPAPTPPAKMSQGSPSGPYSGARRRREPDEEPQRRAVLPRIAQPDVQYRPDFANSSASDMSDYETSSDESTSEEEGFTPVPEPRDMEGDRPRRLPLPRILQPPRDEFGRVLPIPPPVPIPVDEFGNYIIPRRYRRRLSPLAAPNSPPGQYPSTPECTAVRRRASLPPAYDFAAYPGLDERGRCVRPRLPRQGPDAPPDYHTLSGLLPPAEDMRNDFYASMVERPQSLVANPGDEQRPLVQWRGRNGVVRPRRRSRAVRPTHGPSNRDGAAASASSSSPRPNAPGALILSPLSRKSPGRDASLEPIDEGGDEGGVFSYHNHHWYAVAHNVRGTFVTPSSFCPICTRPPLRQDSWSEAVPRMGSTWTTILPRAGLELIEGGGNALPALPSDDELSLDNGPGVREYRGTGFSGHNVDY